MYIVFPPISSLYEICISAADILKHLAGLDCWIMGNAKPYHGTVVVSELNLGLSSQKVGNLCSKG